MTDYLKTMKVSLFVKIKTLFPLKTDHLVLIANSRDRIMIKTSFSQELCEKGHFEFWSSRQALTWKLLG